MDSDQNILWFDIPVHDVLFVEIFQSSGHLGDILSCFPFGEFGFFPQMFVKFSFPGKFQNQKDSFAVVEMAVEAKDIGVS